MQSTVALARSVHLTSDTAPLLTRIAQVPIIAAPLLRAAVQCPKPLAGPAQCDAYPKHLFICAALSPPPRPHHPASPLGLVSCDDSDHGLHSSGIGCRADNMEHNVREMATVHEPASQSSTLTCSAFRLFHTAHTPNKALCAPLSQSLSYLGVASGALDRSVCI